MRNELMGVIPYTGNKQELLPVLFELFPTPDSYTRFVDCFCGGLSVSLNAPKPVLSNDYDKTLIRMYETIATLSDLSGVAELIHQHRLSRVDKEAYEDFRDLYNQHKDPLWLYILIMHSFSNINRTNDDGEFNAPFGNRTINSSTFKRFEHFKNNVGKINFTSGSFIDLDIKLDDFVYCDPPYLITNAAYNKFWGEDQEHLLYRWLDDLDCRGVRFGLSNVTHHAGKENEILINWMKKYHVHDLDKKYLLGQHTDGFEQNKTKEVYVCNYQNTVNKSPFNLEDFM